MVCLGQIGIWKQKAAVVLEKSEETIRSEVRIYWNKLGAGLFSWQCSSWFIVIENTEHKVCLLLLTWVRRSNLFCSCDLQWDDNKHPLWDLTGSTHSNCPREPVLLSKWVCVVWWEAAQEQRSLICSVSPLSDSLLLPFFSSSRSLLFLWFHFSLCSSHTHKHTCLSAAEGNKENDHIPCVTAWDFPIWHRVEAHTCS